MKDRKTDRVSAEVVVDTIARALPGFIHVRIVHDARPYGSLKNHETAKRSHMEQVRGSVQTNDIGSFWSMLNRAHMGTIHERSVGQRLPYKDPVSDWQAFFR